MKPVAVARTRVGKSSGAHEDIQVYCPDAKKPIIAPIMSNRTRFSVSINCTGTSRSDIAKNVIVTGLRPRISERKPNAT
jgi:hypothetical protein